MPSHCDRAGDRCFLRRSRDSIIAVPASRRSSGFRRPDECEPPALKAVPHYQYPLWASYDGQFYAQRALDPLLRDPTIDRGMDLAPFRARRILFSWTAYGLGLGRPAWILEAYALQNVVCWLIIALLLVRWVPVTSWRGPRALGGVSLFARVAVVGQVCTARRPKPDVDDGGDGGGGGESPAVVRRGRRNQHAGTRNQPARDRCAAHSAVIAP